MITSLPAGYWAPPLIAGITALALAALVWVRRPSAPGKTLGFYLLSIAIWSLGYYEELLGSGVGEKLFWSKVEYLGAAAAPLMGLFFVLQYSGLQCSGPQYSEMIRWTRPRWLLLLGIVPVLTQFLAWTNEWHGWIWRRFWLKQSGLYAFSGRVHGPWFWVFLAYSYALSLVSIYILFGLLFRQRGVYRSQVAVLLIGCTVPLAGNAMHAFGWGPLAYLDLTVFGFCITGAAMAWALFRFQLPALIPVAPGTVLSAKGDGVVVLDARRVIVELNEEASGIFGFRTAEILGQPAATAFREHKALLSLCAGQREQIADLTIVREGVYRRFDVTYSVRRGQAGAAIGALLILRDVTARDVAAASLRQAATALERGVAERTEDLSRTIGELRDLRDQLTFSASHDSLTGLANRKLFLEQLSDRLRTAGREGDAPFAILFLDVDRFKVYNDGYGHDTGDLILIAISNKLRSCFRDSDTVARMGGDEFTVLVSDLDSPAGASQLAERCRAMLSIPVRIAGRDIQLSASIGIVVGSDAHRNAEEMLRDADLAMYRAKRLGGDTTVLFGESMLATAVSQLQLEQDLRLALKRAELAVHYQPFVRLKTGEIVGFEALVRWRHPERGMLLAGEFLPVAEQTGLIMAIDDFVLRDACRQKAKWEQAVPDRAEAPFVSVNVSGWQFFHAERWWQGLSGLLGLYETTAAGLRLEITETALIANARAGNEFFEHLLASDLQIYLDDFGIGYSSLSWLSQFPIQILKVDRSFVQGIAAGGKDLTIVRAILALAHGLHMEVVAEGIENHRQAEILQELGCEYGQGFYFSLPVDGPTALEMVHSGALAKSVSQVLGD